MAATHPFTTAVQNHVEMTDLWGSLSTALHCNECYLFDKKTDKTQNKESKGGI